MKKFVIGLLISAAVFAAQGASVFVNPSSTVNGNCAFSTTCAADIGAGDTYAAQLFSLSSATTLTSASFTIFVGAQSSQPSAANWKFLASDGSGGLPGAVLASGNGTSITSRTPTNQSNPFGLALVEESFALPSVNLAAGSYYFAVQAISTEFDTHLSEGTLEFGAAQTTDGGLTWQLDYGNAPNSMKSVAVSVFGEPYNDVPEPGSLALLGLGLLAAGTVRRLNRKTT